MGWVRAPKLTTLPDFDGAACQGEDPRLFISDEEGDRGFRSAIAKQICWRCPVRKPCLDYANSDRNLLGVWGGTTWRDRWEAIDV